MQGDEERCLAAGMDGYVTKPIQPAALAAAIERWSCPRDSLPAASRPRHARRSRRRATARRWRRGAPRRGRGDLRRRLRTVPGRADAKQRGRATGAGRADRPHAEGRRERGRGDGGAAARGRAGRAQSRRSYDDRLPPSPESSTESSAGPSSSWPPRPPRNRADPALARGRGTRAQGAAASGIARISRS